MVFSSHIFLFYFLPLALAAYFLAGKKWRNAILTLSSYIFYGWGEPMFVLLLLLSTCIDWGCGLILMDYPRHSNEALVRGGTRTRKQRTALMISVISNLSLLGFFKYCDFGIANWNMAVEALLPGHENLLLPLLHIALPLGISFYTFQSMSYTIDVYRGDAKGITNLVDFACYVSLFPQLVAGPIVRFQEVANQMQERVISTEKFARGVAAGGLYHYGSSNDLNWFVTRTEGDNTIINKGRESWLCTLYETDTRFDTEKAVKISDEAGFIDIHVYDNKASKKAAAHNRKRKEGILSGTIVPQEQSQAYKGLSKEALEKLPVNKLGETFRWENNTADSRILNHKGEFLRSCRVVPQGRAFLGQNGRMHLAGGHCISDDKSTAAAMVEAAKFTNQFTLELQFVSHNMDVSGPARIASCSQDWSKRNWTIGQEKNQLMLRIRTRTNGENGSNTQISLGEIQAGKPYHLILSYTPGYTLWSLNGKIGMNHNITDKIDNWQPYTLIFGNEFSGERNWYGEIQGVHTYAYAFSVKVHRKERGSSQEIHDGHSVKSQSIQINL